MKLTISDYKSSISDVVESEDNHQAQNFITPLILIKDSEN